MCTATTCTTPSQPACSCMFFKQVQKADQPTPHHSVDRAPTACNGFCHHPNHAHIHIQTAPDQPMRAKHGGDGQKRRTRLVRWLVLMVLLLGSLNKDRKQREAAPQPTQLSKQLHDQAGDGMGVRSSLLVAAGGCCCLGVVLVCCHRCC